MKKRHSPQFQRYIDQGQRAALTHPDYDQLDPFTTAKDVIGNLLHWVEDTLTPDDVAAGGEFSPEGLLDAALRGYHGDFEDDYSDDQRHLIDQVQLLRDDAQAHYDEYDRPYYEVEGGWLDGEGMWKDSESEAEAQAVEAKIEAFDAVLKILRGDTPEPKPEPVDWTGQC